MGKQIYRLVLDDFSAAAFTTFSKSYFGTLEIINDFINALKKDKKSIELTDAFDKYIGGDESVTHNVAYQNVPFLQRAKLLGMEETVLIDYKWEHTNTWFCPYYMKCSKVESIHIWISYRGKYARCIKSTFTDLQVQGIQDGYMDIGDRFWGYPHQIEHEAPYTYNRMYVVEKSFKNKSEAMADMESFKKKPDVDFTEVLNDIFADG